MSSSEISLDVSIRAQCGYPLGKSGTIKIALSSDELLNLGSEILERAPIVLAELGFIASTCRSLMTRRPPQHRVYLGRVDNEPAIVVLCAVPAGGKVCCRNICSLLDGAVDKVGE
jgi:hypothetical protein